MSFSYDSHDDFPELFERNLRQRWLMREKERRELRKASQNSDSSAHRTVTVYFTKNGERVGETACSVPRGGLYPLVVMLSQGERCRVDFHPLSG